MLTENQDSSRARWRFDPRRAQFVALAAAVIAVCNVGGIWLSSHFGTERNVYGKLLLGLCMITIPLSHPKWRNNDRRDAKNVIADVCVAWLLGLGAETAYLVALRPAGLRVFDVVGLAGVSLALAAFSIGLTGAVDAVAADVRRIATHRDTLPAAVGGPYVVLSPVEETRTLMRTERWMYCGFFIILFAAFAARGLHHQQYLWAAGSLAICAMFAAAIVPPPAGATRRLTIYACLGIAVVPMVKLLVFG